MQRRSINQAGEPELADRLALTSQDRRLEERVLLHIIRASEGDLARAPYHRDFAQAHAVDAASPTEASICAHAMNIASYLYSEYGLHTVEQTLFVSELAVELAQRINEILNGLPAISPEPPRA
jgi:hypothetical protein